MSRTAAGPHALELAELIEDPDVAFVLWLLAEGRQASSLVSKYVSGGWVGRGVLTRLNEAGFLDGGAQAPVLTARGIRALKVLQGGYMTTSELSPAVIEDLSWEPEDADRSLELMREFAKWRANDAISWYESRSSPARRNARGVRFGAILSAAMAGVVPVISQLAPSTVPPSTATLALAVSGLLLALDKFFGFSSSWMRFTSTGLKLRSMLSDFELNWERQRAEDVHPDRRKRDYVVRRLDTVTKFVSAVDGVVQNETNAWMAEFSGVLKAAEEAEAPAEPA